MDEGLEFGFGSGFESPRLVSVGILRRNVSLGMNLNVNVN